MTREEASFILANIDRRVCDDELNEALDMAIKALEQEPILDKIRYEIESHCGLVKENHCKYCSYCNSVMGVREILEIIDECKAEVEPQESEDI